MVRRLNLPMDVAVVGPFQGRLSNERDRLVLERLYEEVVAGNLPATRLRWFEEDRVEYRSESPWPLPSGTDLLALTRRSLAGFGSEPENWEWSLPSPGDSSRGSAPIMSERLINGLSLTGGVLTLELSLQPGRSYQVQIADRIEGDWELLQRVSGEISQLQVTDEILLGAARFFRVVPE